MLAMLCIACGFKTLIPINYPLIIINTRFARFLLMFN